MSTKNILAFTFLALTGMACNPAADGFDPPFGSSITVSSDQTFTTTGNTLFVYQIAVLDEGGLPMNNIQLTTFCSNDVACQIYDRAAGQNVTVPDLSRLDAKASPYVYTTGGQGTHDLVIFLPAPATLGVTEYEVSVFSNTAVSSGVTTFTVSEPE